MMIVGYVFPKANYDLVWWIFSYFDVFKFETNLQLILWNLWFLTVTSEKSDVSTQNRHV